MAVLAVVEDFATALAGASALYGRVFMRAANDRFAAIARAGQP